MVKGITDAENQVFVDRRLAALRARNPEEYFRYCVASGMHGTEDSELYEEGASLFERASGRYRPNTDGGSFDRGNRRSIDYSLFLELSEQFGLNPDSFSALHRKREVLIQAGNKNAYVKTGRKVPLRDATDERIAAMFRRVYARALKATQSAQTH